MSEDLTLAIIVLLALIGWQYIVAFVLGFVCLVTLSAVHFGWWMQDLHERFVPKWQPSPRTARRLLALMATFVAASLLTNGFSFG